MLELTTTNAAAYLSDCHGMAADSLRVQALGGGVSNIVLLVESPGGRLVLKQALGKLRVEQDWFSNRERIFREADALRALAPLLPAESVPDILFEDRANYVYAMSAAPPEASPWKSLLLEGKVSTEVGERVAAMLAAIINASWESSEWMDGFGDLQVFDELRLDPYYRAAALRHADLAEFFHGLADEYPNHRRSLVHGDWSPKNFLVSGDSPMAIDFEVIHFGDPAFDAAFLLNHLVLKAFYRPGQAAEYRSLAERFWRVLTASLAHTDDSFESRTVAHLGALMLARVDGKSPAEYIRSEDLRGLVRGFARGLILDPPGAVPEVFARISGG